MEALLPRTVTSLLTPWLIPIGGSVPVEVALHLVHLVQKLAEPTPKRELHVPSSASAATALWHDGTRRGAATAVVSCEPPARRLQSEQSPVGLALPPGPTVPGLLASRRGPRERPATDGRVALGSQRKRAAARRRHRRSSDGERRGGEAARGGPDAAEEGSARGAGGNGRREGAAAAAREFRAEHEYTRPALVA